MSTLYDRLVESVAVLEQRTGRDRHDVVVVLGSGLGVYAERLEDVIAVPYRDLPGFPIPAAVGHSGTAYSTEMGENRVLLLAGRAHAYEGHSMEAVTFPIRASVLAGCRTVVLTNAAGGCGEDIEPGDLVVITDHINLSGISPLAGQSDERLGPRFQDMTDVYPPALRKKAHNAADLAGLSLKEGIYLWWQGPMYETPAEIRMAQKLGADLVGMSTVPEATAARHMGADVLGISLCTNLAAGLSGQRLSAEEVIEMAAQSSEKFGSLLDQLLPPL